MRAELLSYLESFGLNMPNIVNMVDQMLEDDPTVAGRSLDVLVALRNTPEYKQRFKGNELRRQRGLPEYTEADYISAENSYRIALRSNGMPKGFYDRPEDFATFIANDVSGQELNDRIQNGYRAVMEAPAGTKEELKRLYGLQDSEIAAYFLDPERFTQTDVIRKAEAAQRAQVAREQAGIQLTTQQAEQIAQRVSQAEAQQGFGAISQMGEIFTPTTGEQLAGEKALTQEEQIAGTFGISPEAAQRIRKRQRQRTATFEAGGTFATGGTRATGLTVVGE